MIWGLTLEPGKNYTRIMGDEIQLSMASLETRDEFGSDPHPNYTQVILTTKRSEYLLCTLAHGTAFQQNLDLRLRPSETVTFSVQGKSLVYLMGYSSSDSEISDSIEVNFEVDEGEDVISEFADSERACSPTILPAPPSTLHDDSMCDVSETAPVMSRGPRRDEMEGTGDVPPPTTKQEEGEAELPQEQREEYLHIESVPVKEEAVDSPQMSCHGNSIVQMPPDDHEIPQRRLPVPQVEPCTTHSHTVEFPYALPQRSGGLNQDDNPRSRPDDDADSNTQVYEDNDRGNLTQGYHGSVQERVVSHSYRGDIPDNNAHRYQGDSQDGCQGDTEGSLIQDYQANVQANVTHQHRGKIQEDDTQRHQVTPPDSITQGYEGSTGDEPMGIIPVGLTGDYHSQESEVQIVWPVGTSGRRGNQRFLQPNSMPTMSRQTGVTGNDIRPGMKPPLKKRRKQMRPVDLPGRLLTCQCPYCSLIFNSQADQLVHQELDHGELGKNQALTCQYCGWRSQGIRNLKVHLYSHTGEKPHRCSICGKSFSQSQNRKRHERTHTGIRPYRCQICNMTFTQNHHRKKHQLTHQQES